MWINFDVRCGSISFLSALALFIIVYGLFTRKKNLTYKNNIDKLVNKYFIYAVLIYLPFMLLSTDLSVLEQLNAMKSHILSVVLLAIVWKWKATEKKSIKQSSKYVTISIIALCLYGFYSYQTMTNPYMDIMAQYCTKNDLSDLLARSMEDARGNLHGRITGTALYTIQYAILLVIVFFYYYGTRLLQAPQKMTLIVYVLLLLNIYLTGSRGPLGAILIAFAFYLMRTLSWRKKVSYTLLLSFLVFFGWPILEPYLSLFTNQKDISGSSFELRSIQFGGAFSMVDDDWQSLLFGKGIGYTTYYLQHYGPHPLALFFESTHVSGIVNYGVLGLLCIFVGNLLFLSYIAFSVYKHNLIGERTYYLLLALILAKFIYNLLVGDVYSTLFLFVYFALLKTGMIQKKYLLKT